MRTSDTITSLAPALVAFQSACSKIGRNSIGQIGNRKYGYASLAALRDTIAQPLADAQLAVIQSQQARPEDAQVIIVTRVLHSSGEWHECDVVLPRVSRKDDTPETAQTIASVTTYGRRQGLKLALGLAEDDDDDGAAASGHPADAHHSRPQPPTSQPARPAPAADGPEWPEFAAWCVQRSGAGKHVGAGRHWPTWDSLYQHVADECGCTLSSLRQVTDREILLAASQRLAATIARLDGRQSSTIRPAPPDQSTQDDVPF